MTPRQHLEFAFKSFRPDLDAGARDAQVDELLSVTGLASCQDTRAGGFLFKGLSGGQRGRLSRRRASQTPSRDRRRANLRFGFRRRRRHRRAPRRHRAEVRGCRDLHHPPAVRAGVCRLPQGFGPLRRSRGVLRRSRRRWLRTSSPSATRCPTTRIPRRRFSTSCRRMPLPKRRSR